MTKTSHLSGGLSVSDAHVQHHIRYQVNSEPNLSEFTSKLRSVNNFILFLKISVVQVMRFLNYPTVRMKTSGWRKKMNIRLKSVCCASSVTGSSFKREIEK